jgi:hypothetical protein
MTEVIGRSDHLVLIGDDTNGVIIDTDFNLIVESGPKSDLQKSKVWVFSESYNLSDDVINLANAALQSFAAKALTASAGRMYTIPKSAQAEAKKALEWHATYHRGGTPVGLNTARTLSGGGQVSLKVVKHIAKYFPRHEVDKKGKGYTPGEDGFPSNGRIAWALWGGDAAWRWASDIVEREKKALTADGQLDSETLLNNQQNNPIAAFQEAFTSEAIDGPEFIARVRLDGSGIDRLYKVDIDGSVYVWDNCNWDDLCDVDSDIWTFDKALDDPYDLVSKSHILIDPSSAVVIAARLDMNPFECVSVFDIDSEEAILVADAISDIDWDLIDNVVTAAGAQVAPGYTPEERAQNAEHQKRATGGKFAKQKSATLPAKGTGKDVPAAGPKEAPTPSEAAPADADKPEAPKLDLTGILAKDPTPAPQPAAKMAGNLPAMSAPDVHNMLSKWDSFVQSKRGSIQTSDEDKNEKRSAVDKATAAQPAHAQNEKRDVVADAKQSTEAKATNPYAHPLVQDWVKNKAAAASSPDATKQWAVPTVAAAGPAGTPVTPENSDVQPVYVAIVADDDPRAVLDLVAIVPASTTQSAPMTYVRKNKKWVRDDKMLNDLKSATPPPTVPLDATTLDSVLKQVDGIAMTAAAVTGDQILNILWGPNKELVSYIKNEVMPTFKYEETLAHFDNALVAGGGLDRDRGQAEKLRHYWDFGPGAAKIRWGMPGDWSRCVRHLAKYLGVRAKGYCQLRHKEVTGMYTGTHAKLVREAEGKGGHHHEHSISELATQNFDSMSDHSADDPCWDGYKQIGFKDKNGKHVPNCVKASGAKSEFIMEEVWGENIGTPTVVTDKDMLMPLPKIMNLKDDIYDHHWEPDEETIGYLKHLNECDDADFEALTAAGTFKPSAGSADKLRNYWVMGKGAAKIRWNTNGDWTRCVQNLSKYMGPRARGWCALRAKEVSNNWVGDKGSRQVYGKLGKLQGTHFSNQSLNATNHVIELAALNARSKQAKNRVLGLTAGAGEFQPGAAFRIPLVIPEGIESGDGRKFLPGAITTRELPLPLLWQIKTGDGHQGSVVVGRIDHMERIENGIGNAYGVFDNGEYGQEAQRLIQNGFIRGVSADMDRFEAIEEPVEAGIEDQPEVIGKNKLVINKARVMAATIVAKPAFQECQIFINKDELPQEENMIPDGVYAGEVDPSDANSIVACGFVAGAIPVEPPASWFVNPKLDKATPLTITDDGRVFGHIAAWHVDHIGMAFGTKPPRSKSNYGYFHTGVVRTEDGSDVPVGQLTLAGGHASLHASAQEAVKHYDDTASAFADVHAGEDAHGIWVAGSLRPGTTPEQIRAARASAPSGDWRPIRGSLELVAVCQVNVPGFPIARARVASGQVVALVAAGAMTLAKMKNDPVAELSNRINQIEASLNQPSVEARAAEIRARMESEFGYIPQAKRQEMAKKGEALPDGSYPIATKGDVEKAIHAYGRAKPEHKAAVKKHIIKRAKSLGVSHLIPDSWKPVSAAAITASVDDLRARLASFAAVTDFAEISDEERKKLASEGKAMPDGSYPIRNEQDLKNAIQAFGRAKTEDRPMVKAHIKERAHAINHAELIPDNWKN